MNRLCIGPLRLLCTPQRELFLIMWRGGALGIVGFRVSYGRVSYGSQEMEAMANEMQKPFAAAFILLLSGTKVLSWFHSWWLIIQVKFSGNSSSERRLSTLKNPSDGFMLITDLFSAGLQLMLAAGFPCSALQTATVLLPSYSSQADILGATTQLKTKYMKLIFYI